MKKEKKKNEKVKKKELNYGLISILYIACSIIWFISAALNYEVDNTNMVIFDIIFGFFWLVLAIVYYRRAKKNKQC